MNLLLLLVLFTLSRVAFSNDGLSITYGGKFIYSMYGGSQTTGDENIYFKDSSGFSYKAYSNPQSTSNTKSRLEDYSSYFITHFNYKIDEENIVGSSIYANMAGQIRLFTKSDSKVGDWTTQTRMRVNGEMFNSQYQEEHPEVDGWFYLSYAYARLIHESGFTMKIGSAQNIDMYVAGYDVIEKISFRQNNMKDALFTTNESMFSAFHLGYTGYDTNTEVYLGVANSDDLVYNNGSNQTSSFSTGGVCVLNNGKSSYNRSAAQRCYSPSWSNANETLEGDLEQTTILGARSYGKATAGTNLYYGVEINYFKNSLMTSSQETTPTSDTFISSMGLSYRFMQENSKMIEPFVNLSMVRKYYENLYTASTDTSGVDGRGSGFNDQYTFNIGTNIALDGGLQQDGYINLGVISQRFDNNLTVVEGVGVGEEYGYASKVNGVDIIYAKGFSKEITGYTGLGFSKIYILDDYSVENNTDFHYNEYNLGFGLVAKL